VDSGFQGAYAFALAFSVADGGRAERTHVFVIGLACCADDRRAGIHGKLREYGSDSTGRTVYEHRLARGDRQLFENGMRGLSGCGQDTGFMPADPAGLEYHLGAIDGYVLRITPQDIEPKDRITYRNTDNL